MKVYQIVFSPTGGTQKVADIITKEISEYFLCIDLSKRNTDFSQTELSKEDIAIIAMPSFGGRAPKIALERLEKIKADNAKAILVCTYGNRDFEDTLVEMQDTAQSAGFNVIAAIAAVAEHSIIREYGANRPDNKDIEQLKNFAQKIKERFSEPDSPHIKGNRPYKNAGKVNLYPQTNKNCTNCKQCVAMCPVGAIPSENVKKIDKTKCISCMRCMAKCPQQAKNLNKIMKKMISVVLKKMCSDRKENELF